MGLKNKDNRGHKKRTAAENKDILANILWPARETFSTQKNVRRKCDIVMEEVNDMIPYKLKIQCANAN